MAPLFPAAGIRMLLCPLEEPMPSLLDPFGLVRSTIGFAYDCLVINGKYPFVPTAPMAESVLGFKYEERMVF